MSLGFSASARSSDTRSRQIPFTASTAPRAKRLRFLVGHSETRKDARPYSASCATTREPTAYAGLLDLDRCSRSNRALEVHTAKHLR